MTGAGEIQRRPVKVNAARPNGEMISLEGHGLLALGGVPADLTVAFDAPDAARMPLASGTVIYRQFSRLWIFHSGTASSDLELVALDAGTTIAPAGGASSGAAAAVTPVLQVVRANVGGTAVQPLFTPAAGKRWRLWGYEFAFTGDFRIGAAGNMAARLADAGAGLQRFERTFYFLTTARDVARYSTGWTSLAPHGEAAPAIGTTLGFQITSVPSAGAGEGIALVSEE